LARLDSATSNELLEVFANWNTILEHRGSWGLPSRAPICAYLSVQYRCDPAAFAPGTRRDAAAWTTGFMGPAEQQFIDRLGAWMVGARQPVRNGYRGRSAGASLPEL
jgi:hypothetical protein